MQGDVFFLQLGIAGEEESFHGHDQAAVVGIQFNDLERQLFAQMESIFGVFKFGNGEMGDRHKAFHHIVIHYDIDQNAFGDELADLAPDLSIDGKLGGQGFPGIAPELFDAQSDAVQGAVDGKDNGFHFLVFLEEFLGMIDALGPADVRDVDQSVDAFLDLDESAECGQAFYLAGKDSADGIAVFNGEPGIGFHLFHSEGDAFAFLVQFQDDGVDGVVDFEDAAGVGDLFGPGHFGDMDQAFNTGLDLDKCAVGLDTDDFSCYSCSFRILDLDVFPGMRDQLLEAE